MQHPWSMPECVRRNVPVECPSGGGAYARRDGIQVQLGTGATRYWRAVLHTSQFCENRHGRSQDGRQYQRMRRAGQQLRTSIVVVVDPAPMIVMFFPPSGRSGIVSISSIVTAPFPHVAHDQLLRIPGFTWLFAARLLRTESNRMSTKSGSR